MASLNLNKQKEKPTGTSKDVREKPMRKSYAEMLKARKTQKVVCDDEGWTTISYRKKAKAQTKPPTDLATILLANIPVDASTRSIWDFFKGCGEIKDIILPMKRDRINKRIGFIKIVSKLEAGIIINTVKDKGGWGRRIGMTIN